MKSLLVLLLATASVPALAQPPAFTTKDAKALGAADTAQFYAGNTSPLWDAMSADLQKLLKDPAGLQDFQHKVAERLGKETSVLHDSVLTLGGGSFSYVRIVEFSLVEQPLIIQWSFSPDGKSILAFSIKPEDNPAPTRFADYKDKSAFILPVGGSWTVYQGGPSVGDNYHAATYDQHFSYDLSQLKDGALNSGDGSKDTDYYSFGQPVLAPAAGKIISADDSYADNAPGKGSDSDPAQGNSIVIDHGNGEFSMLAHLKSGSIKVKVGDTVKAGDVIAQVGQSGNAPVPHLHYHLQNTAIWQKGEGLPLQFQHALVNGKPVPNASPLRGDVVETKAAAK
jgi:murein DD-endopeptidase MepM/ murein hydrolase activator NlpD